MASAIYELIGRFVVRSFWLRFGGQVKVAGGVFAVFLLVAGYLIAKREPPEG
ncbi:MAG: hypothetical protein ACHQJ5_03090 [Vicinamibacteria bacterium]|jgi:hypothetical protein